VGAVRSIFIFAVMACLMSHLLSCKKDSALPGSANGISKSDTTPGNDTIEPGSAHGSLVFRYKALANGKLLTASGTYSNSSGEAFTVTKFNYYISNIRLTGKNDSVYAVPESYYLVKHMEGSESFTLTGIPAGTYSAVEFLIGVDSARNVSGAQTGALDEANGMFWTWNTGYIFLKLEGMYVSTITPNADNFAIHIGGFTEPANCIRRCTFNLAVPVQIGSDKQSGIYFNAQADEIFTNPSDIGIEAYFASPGPKTDKAIADNYKDMFVVEKVEN
jgi:hypothetical protein